MGCFACFPFKTFFLSFSFPVFVFRRTSKILHLIAVSAVNEGVIGFTFVFLYSLMFFVFGLFGGSFLFFRLLTARIVQVRGGVA